MKQREQKILMTIASIHPNDIEDLVNAVEAELAEEITQSQSQRHWAQLMITVRVYVQSFVFGFRDVLRVYLTFCHPCNRLFHIREQAQLPAQNFWKKQEEAKGPSPPPLASSRLLKIVDFDLIVY